MRRFIERICFSVTILSFINGETNYNAVSEIATDKDGNGETLTKQWKNLPRMEVTTEQTISVGDMVGFSTVFIQPFLWNKNFDFAA